MHFLLFQRQFLGENIEIVCFFQTDVVSSLSHFERNRFFLKDRSAHLCFVTVLLRVNPV